MSVLRIDTGTVRSVQRTPQGGLRVDAAIARTGVLQYRDNAGNEWGELRPEEEVFRPDSLATLRDAPVTVGHPDAPVTAETWSKLSKGHVGSEVRRDGDYVAAPVVVQDADAVKRCDTKELHDTSAGYLCDLDETPGTFGGVPYARVQRNIRFNHVALLPEGAGRSGTDVALRMDGAAMQVSAAPAAKVETMKLTIAGKVLEIRNDADMVPAQAAVDQVQAKADAGVSGMEALQTKVTELLTQIATLAAQAKAAQAAEEAAEAGAAGADDGTEQPIPEEVLDAKIAEREKLRADATLVLGATFDPKGKTADALRVAVLEKLAPSIKLDAKDAKGVAHYDAKTRIALYDAAIGAYVAAKPVRRSDAHREIHRFANEGNPAAKSIDEIRADAHQAEMERGRKPLA